MTATSGGQRLGVALSGGGHRATVWGWDTLVAALVWAAALRRKAASPPLLPARMKAVLLGGETAPAALTPKVAADLLEHAYLLTRVNAYVVLGLRELPDDAGPFRRERFEVLT